MTPRFPWSSTVLPALLASALLACGAPQNAAEPTPSDADGDTILSTEDQCPGDAEDLDGFEDGDGCPDPDNDGDALLDVDDRCPDAPEDRDYFQDADGCPDPDNDGDRILDVDDQCPCAPEVYNGMEDEDGCPDCNRVLLVDNRIMILDKVYFDHNDADIQPRSLALIDAVAEILNQFPAILRISVHGHAARNERRTDRLSAARAEAVRAMLIERGVDPSRMDVEGHGATHPIREERTREAYEYNRRVEFQIDERAPDPDPPRSACNPAPIPDCGMPPAE